MKKRFLQIAATALVIALGGCGGGGSPAPAGGGDANTTPPAVTHHFKYDRISIAGSSITHGDIKTGDNQGEGYLGELSYVGTVEKYFRENVADTIGPDQLPQEEAVIETPMSYQGKLKVYSAGKSLTGTLKASDEIAIVFGGSDVDTTIRMDVDGETFTYQIPAGDYLPVKKVFDDTNTDFYKAFRENNPQAVKVWKLGKDQAHTFTLTILSGELHLNFITNHMYYFQNAGVGGFEANDFLSEFREHSTVKDIIAFNPDLFVFESSTNDAKTWARELAGGTESTNSWIVENPVPFTAGGKTITLGQTVSVSKGDVVILGDYGGDIQNMVVGIVADASTGRTVELSKIISYAGQNAHEVNSVPQDIARQCTIKSIALWESRVKEVIKRLKAGVGHSVTVGIGTCGVPNYYKPDVNNTLSQPPYTPRRLLGYREKGQMLAEQNGWFFADFFQKTLEVWPGVDVAPHKWSYGDNTHPNDAGRVLFGNAVIDALRINNALN